MYMMRTIPLLIVGGHRERPEEAERKDQRRQTPQPWQQLRCNLEKIGGIAVGGEDSLQIPTFGNRLPRM
jgi:hypothetical protein